MKYVLTLTALVAAGPALAHGMTPIHADQPSGFVFGAVVLVVAAFVAWRRS